VKNNGVTTDFSNSQLGGFKRTYKSTYSSIVAECGEITNRDKLWHALHTLFMKSNYRDLTSSSFTTLKRLIDKSLLFDATEDADAIKDLTTIYNTMLNVYNITEGGESTGIGATNASFPRLHSVSSVPDTQVLEANEIIHATLTSQTNEPTVDEETPAEYGGQISSSSTLATDAPNNELLTLLHGFMKAMDSKYSAVSEQIKQMSKLIFPKEIIDVHLAELHTHTRSFIRLEHHLLILMNHLENDSTPGCLGVKTFPKPVFHDFGYSQEYIDKYNLIINNSQVSLIELNIDTLHERMANELIELNKIKTILKDRTNINVNIHMANLEDNLRAELQPEFDKANETFLRISIDPFNFKFRVRVKSLKNNLNNSITSINPSDVKTGTDNIPKVKSSVIKSKPGPSNSAKKADKDSQQKNNQKTNKKTSINKKIIQKNNQNNDQKNNKSISGVSGSISTSKQSFPCTSNNTGYVYNNNNISAVYNKDNHNRSRYNPISNSAQYTNPNLSNNGYRYYNTPNNSSLIYNKNHSNTKNRNYTNNNSNNYNNTNEIIRTNCDLINGPEKRNFRSRSLSRRRN